MLLKVRKFQLLIILVAVIGTFTAYVPQLAFTDDQEPGGTCVVVPGFDDEHSITLEVVNRAGTDGLENDINVNIELIIVAPTDLVNVIQVLLINVNDPGDFRFDVGSSTDPTMFLAHFNDVASGDYRVTVCYIAGQPNVAPSETRHSDEAFVTIDNNAPECIPGTPPAPIDDDDVPGVPATDPAIQGMLRGFGCDDGTGVGLDFTPVTGTRLTLSDGSPIPATFDPGLTTVRQTCVDLNGNESFCEATLEIISPEEKACARDGLNPGDDPSDRFCVQSEVRQATCGGQAADAGGILDFLTLDPNQESEKLFFDIETTGDLGVGQAIKISCSRWVDANDPTFNVLIDGAAHISKDTDSLYGGDLQRCIVDAKRLAEVLNGETVRAFIQLRTDLTLQAQNFVGSTISDINIRFQECARVGQPDLDTGSGLPGFDEFGP